MRVRLGLCAIVVSAACGTPMSFTRKGDKPFSAQARGPAQVEVFTTGSPARPHEEVGIIESQQDSEESVANMRAYAAELGCDALVIFSGDEAHVHRGACVAYTAPPLMAPPPVAATPNAPSTCIPNAPQPCYGPGGCRGTQLCSGDGKSFTSCDCSASN